MAPDRSFPRKLAHDRVRLPGQRRGVNRKDDMYWKEDIRAAMAAGHACKQERILVLNGSDHQTPAALPSLQAAGFAIHQCQHIQQLLDEANDAGALLISQHQLHAHIEALTHFLQSQPPWSNLPIILLTSPAAESSIPAQLSQSKAAALLFTVPGPVQPDMLLAVTRSALTARRRQYQLPDLIQQRDAARQAQGTAKVNLSPLLQQEDPHALHESHQHAEYSSSMCTLAAGLGHDLGNLVFPLRIRVDLMRSRDTSPEMQEDLKAIANAVQYLQRLANGLRHMAMDPSETGVGLESVDLNEWWTDVEPVLRNALGRGIELYHKFDRNLPRISVAAHSLTQAIFNLVQNAAEAMRQRGSGRVIVSAARDANSVVLTIVDDGPGMPEPVRRRCMEPFFTTKVRSISTGLGLALARGVVTRAGGTIELSSSIGTGTTWTLTFPEADQTSASPPRLAAVNLSDQRLGAFVTAMLQSLNIQALQTNGSPQPPDEADLWVTDAQEALPHAALDFLTKDPARHVVFLGDLDASPHPRILHSSEHNSTASIRNLFRQLVSTRGEP